MTDRSHRGRAAALRIENLDTDQIMPKQFLRGIDKSGSRRAALRPALRCRRPCRARLRAEPRSERHSILVGGANFGCGSSREHAVWGCSSSASAR
jgi:3-isopropylmalate/(R)-2-methylmalate dehydratase small subunit